MSDVDRSSYMTDTHEMLMVRGRIRPVYTGQDGTRYVVIDGDRHYLSDDSDAGANPDTLRLTDTPVVD